MPDPHAPFLEKLAVFDAGIATILPAHDLPSQIADADRQIAAIDAYTGRLRDKLHALQIARGNLQSKKGELLVLLCHPRRIQHSALNTQHSALSPQHSTVIGPAADVPRPRELLLSDFRPDPHLDRSTAQIAADDYQDPERWDGQA